MPLSIVLKVEKKTPSMSFESFPNPLLFCFPFLAYKYPNQIGLILFGSNVEYKCPITPLFEVFRDQIDKVNASGETCLYDAIEKAGEVLLNFKKTHEKAQLRILCLTDGDDTKSKAKPYLVSGQLQRNSIVLDAIMIAGIPFSSFSSSSSHVLAGCRGLEE